MNIDYDSRSLEPIEKFYSEQQVTKFQSYLLTFCISTATQDELSTGSFKNIVENISINIWEKTKEISKSKC